MKNIPSFVFAFFLAFITLSFSSCQVIGDIFKAGVWSGVIIVAVVVGVIIFIISKVAGGGKNNS